MKGEGRGISRWAYRNSFLSWRLTAISNIINTPPPNPGGGSLFLLFLSILLLNVQNVDSPLCPQRSPSARAGGCSFHPGTLRDQQVFSWVSMLLFLWASWFWRLVFSLCLDIYCHKSDSGLLILLQPSVVLVARFTNWHCFWVVRGVICCFWGRRTIMKQISMKNITSCNVLFTLLLLKLLEQRS